MPEPPSDPVIVVTNPGEDCSPEALTAFLAEMAAGPEPEVETIGAAEALFELRGDAATGAGTPRSDGRRRGQ